MIIGFTGRRDGMSRAQMEGVRRILLDGREGFAAVSGLHGDAIGADAEFDALCKSLGIPTACLPCAYVNMRSFVAKPIAEATNPMARNRNIVKRCEFLIAAPPTMEEQDKGGTWNTIRMARKANKRVIVVLPDGEVQDESPRQEEMFL